MSSYKGKGMSASYKGKPLMPAYYKGTWPVAAPPTSFPTFTGNANPETMAPTRACNTEECCTDADCGNATLYACVDNTCLLRECSLDTDDDGSTTNNNNTLVNATTFTVECCVDADCGAANLICKENTCINTGNPRFTLSWFGNDDLDLHVITPEGVEIDFQFTIDPVSGGELDQDDIPAETARWVENVYFPTDGSAPAGNYTYFVVGYTTVGEPDNYDLSVWEDDTRVAFHVGGGLQSQQESTRFTYVKQEA